MTDGIDTHAFSDLSQEDWIIYELYSNGGAMAVAAWMLSEAALRFRHVPNSLREDSDGSSRTYDPARTWFVKALLFNRGLRFASTEYR